MSDLTDASDSSANPTRKGVDNDDDILNLMRSRLDAGISATSNSRNFELDDLKFAAASPDNPEWQWPTGALTARGADAKGIGERPCLTINKMPQHINQVTNDQRQNCPAGKVIPTNDKAAVEMAEIFEGMVRHIQATSDADVAYGTACDNQVTFGEGYFRILTDWEAEDSFDQVIKIGRLMNSFAIYLDPMIQSPCGEDAEWGVIIDDISKKEYTSKYPNAKSVSSLTEMGVGSDTVNPWIGEDTVRIAEYFYFKTRMEKLSLYPDGSTAFEGSREAEMMKAQFIAPVKSRQSERKQVKWLKTNGYEILEKGDWPGKYIPIIRVIGNEFLIEGERHISGLVRNSKDAQRMYNYHASQEVEMLALSPKAPFIGAAGQFEGFEDKWKTANTTPWPYLEYNPVIADGDDRALPPPQRAQPPMVQQGLIAAKQAAAEDIKTTTGQYNASLGQQSNERSGKAILARQHEGDVGTYHYGDNLARAVRYATRQIIDLIPKIYDTERIAHVMGEDKKTSTVRFDPNQTVPVNRVKDQQGVTIEMIYNPAVGRYDVLAVTGPGYATKRQEASESMANLLQGNPSLWGVAGDIFVKSLDWPGSQELAKRLSKTIDPKLTQDDDENPALQQAQQQMQQMGQELDQLHGMLKNVHNSMEAQELKVKMFDAETKRYDAETKRMVAMQTAMTPDQMHDIAAGVADAAVHHAGMSQGAPQMEQTPQEPPPQLDPNKLLAEQSKHALQSQQHGHEMKMAEMQAEQQPTPEQGE